jgi:hypothetical protein
MVEQVTFQTIFQFLQTVGILVGVYYYIMTIRTNQRNQQIQIETRQAQLFMQMHNRWNSLELRTQFDIVVNANWDDYESFLEYTQNEASRTGFRIVASFVEGIGVLVKRGLIDASFVDDLMSGRIIEFWETLRPFTLESRKRTGDYELAEHIEYLYGVIKSIQDKQRIEAGLPVR